MTAIREASVTVSINADASVVWQKICEPCSILQWNNRIAECTSIRNDQGQIVRYYVLPAMGSIVPTMVETEHLRSEAIMMITYTVEIKELPVSNYVAQILVTPGSNKSGETATCEVCIRSRFIDTGTGPDAKALVEDFYQTGLTQLAALMSGQ